MGALNKWIHEGRKSIMESAWQIESRVDELVENSFKEEKMLLGNPLVMSRARQGWEAPEQGWMAINIDAATKEGKNAFALVARNGQRVIASMATKFTTGLTADMAELSAIEWAVDIVEKQGWPKVLWWSDAKIIVNQINFSEEPCVWKHRHQILALKLKFNKKQWKLKWCPKGSERPR